MKSTIRFSYVEHQIPPRCRKPRPVRLHDGLVTAEVREISQAEAPVAIVAKMEKNRFGIETVAYRFFEGQLWTAERMSNGTPRSETAHGLDCLHQTLPAELDLRTEGAYGADHGLGLHYYAATESRDEIAARLREQAESRLLINGVAYEPAGEPRYVVMTFGLGRNHGGTAVMVDDVYNSNIPHTRYFSLLQLGQALELGNRIATERGDTKNLPMKVHGPEYVVVMPEAIRVNPAAQHGNGDPFLNSLEAMTMAAKGSPVVGLLALGAASQQRA